MNSIGIGPIATRKLWKSNVRTYDRSTMILYATNNDGEIKFIEGIRFRKLRVCSALPFAIAHSLATTQCNEAVVCADSGRMEIGNY